MIFLKKKEIKPLRIRKKKGHPQKWNIIAMETDQVQKQSLQLASTLPNGKHKNKISFKNSTKVVVDNVITKNILLYLYC